MQHTFARVIFRLQTVFITDCSGPQGHGCGRNGKNAAL